MCGLAGIVTRHAPLNPDLLATLLASMRHRGPDDAGLSFAALGPFQIGLASARLSILDLTPAGHMPMSTRDGSLCLVYNGELYNHLDLREQAARLGFAGCASRTDTETLLLAYQAFGLDCFPRLNGMFALALLDHTHQRLVLARDRMGIKPLYYYWDGSLLVFASELKTLALHPAVGRTIDPMALNLYLTLGYVPSPYCLLAGVRKLPPGHLLLLENEALTEYPFWTPALNDADPAPLPDLVDQTRSLFQDAVARQLMGDVPLGVLLSGGLDSTLVAALAARCHPAPLHTFSIGFTVLDPALDRLYNADLLHARHVAQSLGALHHQLICPDRPSDLIPALEAAFTALDQPLWEASHLSLRLLAALAHQHGVKVLLTGDGADELFGGYPWYPAARRLETCEKVPGLRPASRLLAALTPSTSLLHFKALDFGRKYHQPSESQYLALHQHFGPALRRRLLLDGAYASGEELLAHFHRLLAPASALPLADRFAFADTLLWVREHFNPRLDTMLMSASVEGRVPFQDNALLAFALTLPMRLKLHARQPKSLLRLAFPDLLPPAVLSRPKRPFAAPALAWLRGPLKTYALDRLSAPEVDRLGFLAGRQVEAFVHPLLHSGLHGWDAERDAMLVWNLLALCSWLRLWQSS